MTTILLVDDSPTILLSVTAVLVKAGMEAEPVTAEALLDVIRHLIPAA